jgi:hypothetical protein
MIPRYPFKLNSTLSFVMLVMGMTIAVPPASAEARSRSNIISISNESELPMAQSQAMAIAQTELNQGFLDPMVTVMWVGVSGEWSGQIVPLFQIQMTREDWLKNPTIGRLNGRSWNGEYLLAGRFMPSSSRGVATPIAPNPIRSRESEDNFYPNR